MESISDAHLIGTTFTANSASQGGAAVCRTASVFECSGCTFSYNYASFIGGSIYMEQNSYFTIDNSEFFNNTSVKGSAMGFLGCEDSISTLSNSKVYHNTASAIGTISLIMSQL